MSATSTDAEVSATISNLGFRTPPVLLQASPIQQNIKLVTIKRPPNNNGPDGFTDQKGVFHPGYLSLIERIYLTEFVNSIREGRDDVKKAILFCRYKLEYACARCFNNNIYIYGCTIWEVGGGVVGGGGGGGQYL